MTGIKNNESIIYHVSTSGFDGWSGLISEANEAGTDGPFASVAGARDKIRLLRKSGMLDSNVEVIIHTGTYNVTETIKFQKEDLGNEATTVTYRAAGDGEVRFVGGITLKGFEEYRDGIVRLDMTKHDYKGLDFSQLIYEGKRQRKARYPDFDDKNPYGGGWLYVEGPLVNMYEPGHGKKDRFICKDKRLKSWSNISNVELVIFPRFNWVSEIIKLKSYNAETGEVLLQRPASFEIYPGDRFYFQNVSEELTRSGEWYHDTNEDVLYFIPEDNKKAEDIRAEVPLVKNIFEIVCETQEELDIFVEKIDWRDGGGIIDKRSAPKGENLGYINIKGFTIDCCNGAAVFMKNVEGCGVKTCTIKNTAGPGVLVIDGKDCTVEGNDIYEVGSHGVYVSGGIRNPFNCRFIPGNIRVENNYIHHIGNFIKNVAGVSLNGVGLTAAHNYIHDSPRWGIISRGNDNIIEYNHIRHVDVETSDTAGIYVVDRDLTMHGTKIRFNKIHDVLGYHCIDGVWKSPAFAFGIYLDDYTSGYEVKGNLVYRTPAGAMYIHAGKDNVVENNMFLNSTTEMAFFRRWEKEKEYRQVGTMGQTLRNNIFRKNILASTNEGAALYRFDNANDENNKLDVNSNLWESNLVWKYKGELFVKINKNINFDDDELNISFDKWRELGYDKESIAEDPLFENINEDNFTLLNGTPAEKIGFEPLPLDKMGLYESEKRASWPIAEAEGAREHPLV